ncbi:MAG TPA: flagellar protein FlaG [Candidatus Lustribacter sp.]|nr:flagellar protein FlaG [Candidatus Lustribacter sp.]
MQPALAPVTAVPPPSGTSTPADNTGAPVSLASVTGSTNSVASGSTSSNVTSSAVTSTANGSSNSSVGPTPGLATLPAGPPDGKKKGSEADPGLVSAIATLYNVQQQNISVSFQIEQNPNEIVTVFTDKQTGKVIVQFPSETMIALAKLFDKLDGSVVNKKV